MFESNSGYSKLASILLGRVHEEIASPLMIDYGSIQSDLSLKTNNYPISIKKSEYMVSRSVAWGKAGDTLDGGLILSEKMRRLKPGDKVLVAWVQNEPVVIDIVVPATQLE